MNYDLCPTCSAAVPCGMDCDRPVCIEAAAVKVERDIAVKRGKFAYKNYAQFTADPKEWETLHSYTREKWISAGEATRMEAQS